MKKVVVKKNRYVDSVSLMGVSERVTAMQGIENAEAQMASCANQDVLKQLGYELPESVTPNDLVIAITADDEGSYNAALKLAEDIIDRKNVDTSKNYSDINEINPEEDPYDLCQISLPGEYAAAEAKKALAKAADQVKSFVCVELSMGQMIEDVRLYTGCKKPVSLCNRCGGMIPSPDEVLESIRKAAKGEC